MLQPEHPRHAHLQNSTHKTKVFPVFGHSLTSQLPSSVRMQLKPEATHPGKDRYHSSHTNVAELRTQPHDPTQQTEESTSRHIATRLSLESSWNKIQAGVLWTRSEEAIANETSYQTVPNVLWMQLKPETTNP